MSDNLFTGSGVSTSEFKLTVVGLFITALLGLLAAFNVLTLTEQQRMSVMEFAGIAWIALPALYAFARSFVKGREVIAQANADAQVSVAEIHAEALTRTEMPSAH